MVCEKLLEIGAERSLAFDFKFFRGIMARFESLAPEEAAAQLRSEEYQDIQAYFKDHPNVFLDADAWTVLVGYYLKIVFSEDRMLKAIDSATFSSAIEALYKGKGLAPIAFYEFWSQNYGNTRDQIFGALESHPNKEIQRYAALLKNPGERLTTGDDELVQKSHSFKYMLARRAVVTTEEKRVPGTTVETSALRKMMGILTGRLWGWRIRDYARVALFVVPLVSAVVLVGITMAHKNASYFKEKFIAPFENVKK